MKRSTATRVKVPCNDEGDFYVRLADHVAEHGLRITAERPIPIGDRLRVALEFRDGGTLTGEAVVAEHVRIGDAAGMIVRFVRFDRSVAAGEQRAPTAKKTPPPPRPAPPAAPRAPAPPPAAPPSATPPPAASPAAEDVVIPEVSDAVEIVESPEGPGAAGLASSLASAGQRIRAAVVTFGAAAASAFARTSRKQRIVAAAVAAAAIALGVVGYAIARMGPSPEEEAAAHIAAADRKLAAGHVTGDDGALEHLLEAKRLRPGDPTSEERLAHVASLLEKLGARALNRGDLEVASIHLEGARLAAPDRASIRAKLDALEKARRSSKSRARK